MDIHTSKEIHGTRRTIIVILLMMIVSSPFISCSDHCARIDSSDPFAGVRCRVEELMDEKEIASFQVAVARDGQIIYEEAFGWADVQRRIPTTTSTMHLVASIAKPFTSTALMILAERGEIGLHDPVNKYLGGSQLIAYRGDASEATIARLLLHTTGLPYGYYIAGPEVPQENIRSDKDLIDLAGVLVSAPGARYQYTNIGYGLFEEIVRGVTGENTKEFISREIIAPLGMTHTRFFKGAVPADSIATQNVDGGVLPFAYDAQGYTALYSTAGDLVRFGMFHIKAHLADQKPIVSDSGIDLLWTYRESAESISTRRLGWDVQHDYGYMTIQHGGGGPGIHNWLYMIPSEKVVIALMSNAQYGSSNAVLKELIASAVSHSDKSDFRPRAGRGWPQWPVLNPAALSGQWIGEIKGPKGACSVSVGFDSRGNPSLHIDGDNCGKQEWVRASREVKKDYGSLLWRFDACIPYLTPFAIHDEVILNIWREEDRLVGSASAAKEKDFGRGENYVLPQFIELRRSH
ncbi:MAG: beta-lactamase family protein [Spirochaetales bacterium]|nr:beta-lactamase family protein [Spirochaetales bacterium]